MSVIGGGIRVGGGGIFSSADADIDGVVFVGGVFEGVAKFVGIFFESPGAPGVLNVDVAFDGLIGESVERDGSEAEEFGVENEDETGVEGVERFGGGRGAAVA